MQHLFSITIFVSSFLLFLIQPMLTKALLPHVGGAPAVWMSSMLFFQCILLLGYGYAAFGSAYLPPKKQLIVHLCLLLLAIVIALPVQLHMPLDFNQTQPELWVMLVLLLSIGLPYFVLTSNSSLIQRWYHHRFDRSPYHLFSVSNAGSMLGLLGYPFALEWLLPLSNQMVFFSVGFILLALLMMTLGLTICKSGDAVASSQGLGKNVPLKQAARTVFLGFIPSSLFLGVTLYITTDIASFPLLWVIPLSLYLLTFIIAFSSYGPACTKIAQKLHLVALVAAILGGSYFASTWMMLVHFVCFFIIAMSCHGRVAVQKPDEQYLTAYYFWLSLGGALGGLLNTMAPYLFDHVYEYYIVILLSLFALPTMKKEGLFNIPSARRVVPIVLLLAAAVAFMWLPKDEPADDSAKGKPKEEVIYTERNFFGVSTVIDRGIAVVYRHGTTMHSVQPTDAKDKLAVTSYYVPIMQLMEKLPKHYFTKPFGVLGLGGGTTACIGKKGQQLDFFEIDPVVIDIANNPELFTYLRDCPSDIEVFQGDGRLKLAEQADKRYHLLVMDAFTSDAVPLHLLTKEAMGIYISKLDPDQGILMFNISNRHLDMSHVLTRVATEHNWLTFKHIHRDDPDLEYDTRSHWLIMVPKSSPWIETIQNQSDKPHQAKPGTPLWTDDYSNIWPLLK